MACLWPPAVWGSHTHTRSVTALCHRASWTLIGASFESGVGVCHRPRQAAEAVTALPSQHRTQLWRAPAGARLPPAHSGEAGGHTGRLEGRKHIREGWRQSSQRPTALEPPHFCFSSLEIVWWFLPPCLRKRPPPCSLMASTARTCPPERSTSATRQCYPSRPKAKNVYTQPCQTWTQQTSWQDLTTHAFTFEFIVEF